MMPDGAMAGMNLPNYASIDGSGQHFGAADFA